MAGAAYSMLGRVACKRHFNGSRMRPRLSRLSLVHPILDLREPWKQSYRQQTISPADAHWPSSELSQRCGVIAVCSKGNGDVHIMLASTL